MIERKTIEVKGVIDVSLEHGEASITVFEENDDFIDEKHYDILELLSKFDGKNVLMKIEETIGGNE